MYRKFANAKKIIGFYVIHIECALESEIQIEILHAYTLLVGLFQTSFYYRA